MSYNVRLEKGNDICFVPLHKEGGLILAGGSTWAEMTVTYNYRKFFNFRSLDGMKSEDSIPILSEAVKELKDDPDENYWAQLPGNAGHACAVMLSWAKANKDAFWKIT